jgi:hypothetical protein
MQANSYDIAPAKLQKIWALRAISVCIAVGLLALAAPFVMSAVAAGVGMLVLAAVSAVGAVVFYSIPLGMQKLENRLLQLRKEEARRNPIEQLQNELLRRAAKLKSFQQALITVGAQIASISQMLEDRKHKDPAHILLRQERALERLQQFQELNLKRLRTAQGALEEFRFTIERKESEWRISLAIGDATGLLDPNATDNLMQDLLTDTALRSVQERFNAVFAELDVQMISVDAPTRGMLQKTELVRMDALELGSAALPGART